MSRFFFLFEKFIQVSQIENACSKGLIKRGETERESDFLSRTESRYTLQH